MAGHVHTAKTRPNALTSAQQSRASFATRIAAAVVVLSLFILLVHA
jgi:hypothetical protein